MLLQFTVFASLAGSIPQTGTPATSVLFTQFIIAYLAVIGVSLVFGIVNAVLYMRAFNKLREKSGVDTFKTAGLLYLIGVLLTVVLIGGLLVWIAWIFAAMGFNRLKVAPATAPTVSYLPQPPLSTTMQDQTLPRLWHRKHLGLLLLPNLWETTAIDVASKEASYGSSLHWQILCL